MRELLLVFLFVSAGLAGQAATPAKVPQDAPSQAQEGAKKQVTATILSVDGENKTISVQELTAPVAITSATVFDDEVQFDKLKPGTKIKLVVVSMPNNRVEALEVRKAK